jgi:hypothetical protein
MAEAFQKIRAINLRNGSIVEARLASFAANTPPRRRLEPATISAQS